MRVLVLVAVSALLAGCGATQASGRGDEGGNDGPPPLMLLTDPPVDINSGLGCWDEEGVTRCADGGETPLRSLPVVSSDRVDFRFSVPGTRFRVAMTPLPRRRDQRTYSGRVTDLGDGRFSITPQAPAGRYRVGVSGMAEQGDVWGDFVWATSSDADPAPPTSEVSVVTIAHGKLRGWGFHLGVEGLPTTPRSASATITATAANGRRYTFDAGEPELGGPVLGAVTFYELDPNRQSRRVVALGPAPFRYDVTLVLDGTTHHASATWPDDHVDDPWNDNPAPVPLHFDPPLPVS